MSTPAPAPSSAALRHEADLLRRMAILADQDGDEANATRFRSMADADEARADGVPPIGAVLRHVPEGETLAGWPVVATGDGREVVCAPSGSCLHRYDDTVHIDLAWDAMSAYLRARA